MSLKKKWDQFLCLHYWVKGIVTDVQYGRGFKYEYICARCNKRIERWYGNEPISGTTNPLYDKKDPRYNLSPPIIRLDD